MHRYSLKRLLFVMSFGGGWVDRKIGTVLVNAGEWVGKNKIRKICMDDAGNKYEMPEESERYLRIPELCAGKATQAFLEKHKYPHAILEQYGITQTMLKKVMNATFPAFQEENLPINHEEMETFYKNVADLADNTFEDLLDTRGYAYDDALKWCRENGLDIIDDYADEEE